MLLKTTLKNKLRSLPKRDYILQKKKYKKKNLTKHSVK